MSRYNNPTPQYFDENGEPLAYGKLYFFESGTSTAKDTFADVGLNTKNSNPVILTGDGRAPNIFFRGAAKVVITDSDEVQFWERDPVTSSSESSFGQQWDSISSYSFNEVVTFNDVLFVSIIDNNLNNNPSTKPTAWTQFDLLKRWNSAEPYKSRDPVIATDFTIYISQTNNNIGNDPVTDGGVNWLPSGAGAGGNFSFTAWDNSKDYGVGEANIVEASDNSYYVSIQTPNLNNDPISSPAYWEQFVLPRVYNSNVTYDLDDVVLDSSDFYVSLVGSNTGNTPSLSPAQWRLLTPDEASEIIFDNTASGLAATDVQAAIDEIDALVDTNISNIATNTADISTNTANIATNTGNIATNTGDIATNASDIATLQGLQPIGWYLINSTPAVVTSEGVGITVSKPGTGRLRVDFNTPRPNANYTVQALANDVGGTPFLLTQPSGTRTANAFQLYIYDVATITGTNAWTDIHLVIFDN